MKYDFHDKQILITGGASGIGRLLVNEMVNNGARTVIIWDIDEVGCEALQHQYRNQSVHIITQKVDLNDADAIATAVTYTLSQCQYIDVLFNNAGIIVGKAFEDHTYMDIQRTMSINTNALMYTTLGFLPSMRARNHGVICNISSAAGLVANPQMSVYCASKWAVTGWSESLRLEMKQQKYDISVTTIMPFYISTGMFEGVRSPIIPIITPEKAVRIILKAVGHRRAMKAMPMPYWFIRLSQGILPLRVYDWCMEHIFGVYASMKTFRGRS